MHSIVRASIACAIPMATISSKWLQLRTSAHTTNRCSLSSAVSSALCCRSRSLLQSLSYCTASTQVLGVLSMMHTTARADRKELLAKKTLCRSRLATTVWGLCFSYSWKLYCDKSRGTRLPLCLRKSISHPIVATSSPFR